MRRSGNDSKTRHGQRVPAYLAQWVHGNVVAVLTVVGAGSTEGQLLRLAAVQEARIEGHPSHASLTGEAAKSATQVLADVGTAVGSARSVHMHEATRGQVLDFDAGRNAGAGTVTIQSSRVEHVRRLSQHLWVNANRAYYKQVSASAAARLAGRWISILPSNPGYSAPQTDQHRVRARHRDPRSHHWSRRT